MASKTKEKKSIIQIEHIWTVLATNVAVDQASQNISLFGVLEQLTLDKKEIDSSRKAESKPLNLAYPFRLVTFLRKVGEGGFDGNVKIEIVDPQGGVLGMLEHEIKFQGDKDRLRVIIEFPGVPITTAGYYFFRVSLKKQNGEYEEISKPPLRVVFK